MTTTQFETGWEYDDVSHTWRPPRTQTGTASAGGGGVGSVPVHEAAVDPHGQYATDADLAAHTAATTSVHGIADTSQLSVNGHTHPVTGGETDPIVWMGGV